MTEPKKAWVKPELIDMDRLAAQLAHALTDGLPMTGDTENAQQEEKCDE